MENKIENKKITQLTQSYAILRALEKEHQELEDCLRQNNNSLIIHSEMISQLDQSKVFTHLKSTLMKQLFQKQIEVQTAYANMLLNGQIRVEEEIEFRNILQEYENRMIELRSNMIDKEIQLAFEMNSKKRQFNPTAEHMRIFNIGLIEEKNVKNLIKEHYKLVEEVKSLENEIKSKTQKTSDSAQSGHQKSGHQQLNKHQEKQKKTNKRTNLKTNPLYIDRLLQRVYTLLKDQIEQEERLKKQHKEAHLLYLSLVQRHKNVVKQYIKNQPIGDSQVNYGSKLKNNQNILNEIHLYGSTIKTNFRKQKPNGTKQIKSQQNEIGQENKYCDYSQQFDQQQY